MTTTMEKFKRALSKISLSSSKSDNEANKTSFSEEEETTTDIEDEILEEEIEDVKNEILED